MMARRSARMSASSMLCVVRTTALPGRHGPGFVRCVVQTLALNKIKSSRDIPSRSEPGPSQACVGGHARWIYHRPWPYRQAASARIGAEPRQAPEQPVRGRARSRAGPGAGATRFRSPRARCPARLPASARRRLPRTDYSKSYLDLIMARLRPAAGARLPAATAGSGAGAPVALGRLDHVPHVAAVDGVHPCRGSRKSESGRKSDPSQGKRVITPFYLGVIGLSI